MMNLVVIIVVAFLILIFGLLILAAFLPKKYSVVREISIERPHRVVFEYLRFLKNQDHFSKWALLDPDMGKEYTGTDGKVGFIAEWDSSIKGVGKGEQEIKNIIPGERIDLTIRFIKPFPGIAYTCFITESLSFQETNVKWGFDSQIKYPMNLTLLFMNMDRSIGEDIETGLINLKRILEK
jgi:hypothetical protein